MDSDRLILWIAFNVFVLGMLALDLGVFHRKAHTVSIKEASIWSAIWVTLALIFNLTIYFLWGQEKALEFLTGYVIEKSLSVDNLFVFLMIFQYFNTPPHYQHRILFWGIIGALLLRALFIITGAALLNTFHWLIYIFGAFLIVTGVRMFFQGDEKIEPENNPVVRLFRRLIPVSQEYHGQNFFIRKEGKWHATLMMVVLIVVETTDVIFAVDSIPAIFAITRDPFIVYTSNVFAILGLRALYFMLAGVMEMFRYLKVGLSFVLCFVGIKMILVDIYKIPIGVSLAVIGGILALAILASLLKRPRAESGAPARSIKLSPVAMAGISLFLVGAVLGLVKLDTITGGPAGHETIAVLRVVERELAAAKVHTAPGHESIASARAALDRAWNHLEQKQYSEAIVHARGAEQTLRGLIKRD